MKGCQGSGIEGALRLFCIAPRCSDWVHPQAALFESVLLSKYFYLGTSEFFILSSCFFFDFCSIKQYL
jgi:hypothetical protein